MGNATDIAAIITALRAKLDEPAQAESPATAAMDWMLARARRRGILEALVLLGCNEAQEEADAESRRVTIHRGHTQRPQLRVIHGGVR